MITIHNKGIADTRLLLIIGVVGAFFFFGGAGILGSFGSDGGADGGSDFEGDNVVFNCESGTTPVITPNTNNKYLSGSDQTDGIFSWKKVGAALWTDVADDTATGALEIGASYDIAVGVQVGDELDQAYGPVIQVDAKCQETETIDILLKPHDDGGDITTVYFDDFDRPNTEITDTAGSSQSALVVRFTGNYREDFGSSFCEKGTYFVQGATGAVETSDNVLPGVSNGIGNVIVLEYNDTMFASGNKPVITRYEGAGVEGFVPTITITPSIHTIQNTANKVVSYAAPAIESDEKLDIIYNYQINSGAIAVDDTAGSYNLTFTLYDVGLTHNTETNIWECGTVDNDGNDVGDTATAPLIQPDSTFW